MPSAPDRKTSRSSRLSPRPTNLIGHPVTSRAEMAAPPRASPSSLVITRPGEFGVVEEPLGDVDRFLTGHRIDDEQRLVRLGHLAHGGELLHQLVVDLETPCGVDDHDVEALLAGMLERRLGQLGRLGLAIDVDGHADSLAQRLELIDGGGALEIGGDQQRPLPLCS